MSWQRELVKGLYAENPIFRIVLGVCPTLAVTSSAMNGLGMGAAVIFVLTCSNLLIALLLLVFKNMFSAETNKKVQKIRIPIFIVIIATFVTITDLAMQAYTPALSAKLGIFIPLIVVNCIILGRAEAFACRNGLVASALDGIGMGLGFTWALTLLGVIREFLGAGQVFGLPVFGPEHEPMLIMILAPGAFITLGLMLGFFNYLDLRKARKKE
jgi:electron transport complex protein RnfE